MLPSVDIYLELSDTLHQSERKVYSVFAMLGDIGGFNGAIIIVPAYLLSFHSDFMY